MPSSPERRRDIFMTSSSTISANPAPSSTSASGKAAPHLCSSAPSTSDRRRRLANDGQATARNRAACRDGRSTLRHGDGITILLPDDSADAAITAHTICFMPESAVAPSAATPFTLALE
jgi:hypothetical protein